ncbi:hypothetical protein F750_3851 [Streptomyces sp. PAMC 26508]|nr:hypothetical protein F750_3851 [Streptomyces sp. PAMC 26508]
MGHAGATRSDRRAEVAVHRHEFFTLLNRNNAPRADRNDERTQLPSLAVVSL